MKYVFNFTSEVKKNFDMLSSRNIREIESELYTVRERHSHILRDIDESVSALSRATVEYNIERITPVNWWNIIEERIEIWKSIRSGKSNTTFDVTDVDRDVIGYPIHFSDFEFTSLINNLYNNSREYYEKCFENHDLEQFQKVRFQAKKKDDYLKLSFTGQGPRDKNEGELVSYLFKAPIPPHLRASKNAEGSGYALYGLGLSLESFKISLPMIYYDEEFGGLKFEFSFRIIDPDTL